MTTAKYKIIEFDDGLSIVPSRWLQTDQKSCKWPTYKSQARVDKAKINNEGPQDDWFDCPVLRIYGSANSYASALEKLEIATKESDVENIMANENTFKESRRNRARKTSCNSDISTTSEGDGPVKNSKCAVNLPDAPTLVVKSIELLHKPVAVPILNKDTRKVNITHKSRNGSDGKKKADKSEESDNDLSKFQMDKDNGLESTGGSAEDNDSNVFKKAFCNLEEQANEGVDNLTLRYLREIVNILNKLTIEIQEVKKEIKKGINSTNTKPLASSRNRTDWSKILPFNNFHQIMEYNNKLEGNEGLGKSMVEFLTCLGGKDDRTKVNTMMEKLLTDELGSKFSRKGQKGKEPFEKLQIGKLVIEAMLQTKNSFTESDIKVQVGNWLSGRKAKLNRSTKPENESTKENGGIVSPNDANIEKV